MIILFIIIIILILFFKKECLIDEKIKILTRQASRWTIASEQDKEPIIAVLHANYGAGYLLAIKDIIETDKFKIITGLDFTEFEKNIVNVQDKATKNLIKKCKSLMPTKNEQLAKAIYGLKK
jgi:hypothetical protein